VIVNGLRRAVRQGNVAPVARRPGDTTIR
jgi:hypothetical protein